MLTVEDEEVATTDRGNIFMNKIPLCFGALTALRAAAPPPLAGEGAGGVRAGEVGFTAVIGSYLSKLCVRGKSTSRLGNTQE